MTGVDPQCEVWCAAAVAPVNRSQIALTNSVCQSTGLPKAAELSTVRRTSRSAVPTDNSFSCVTCQARDREEARLAGFDHHITKPASFEDIDAALKRFTKPADK